jgi:hypothetical protein
MIIDVPATSIPYLWSLIQAHAGQLRKNGMELRPDVAEFAAALVRTAGRGAPIHFQITLERDVLARKRALSAARSRRYRARLRARRQSLSARPACAGDHGGVCPRRI